MATQKISEMNPASTLAGTELIECIQSGTSVRTTATAVANTASALGDVTTGTMTPATDDAETLGTTSLRYSGLHIAPGGFINFGSSDVLITHSTNALAFTGASSGYSFDALVSATFFKRSQQALTGPGAISITSETTVLTTTGADALTLADGVAGQRKTIIMIADGGDGTLTPTNFGNGSTITFADVGDSIELEFAGTDWWIVSNNGCAIA